jgi:hypothetical protein
MKKTIAILICLAGTFHAKSQNVGIGITTPVARLHVADSSVVFSGNGLVSLPANNPPISGTGRRMMWYAGKAAFRSGYVSLANWDNDSVGSYSFGAGFDTKARGSVAVAIGHSTAALANYSTAMGAGSIASGEYSTATGFYTLARAPYSTAMGAGTLAKSSGSFIIGTNNDTSDSPDPLTLSPSDRLFQIGNGIFTRSNAMTVLRDGRIGIGTTNPSSTLHIRQGSSGGAVPYGPLSLESNISTYLGLLTPDNAESGIIFGKNSDNVSGGIIYNNLANPNGLSLRTNGNINRVTITSGGDVGIGTTIPYSKLHIVSNSLNPLIVDGTSPMFMSWAENGVNRGYLGSYTGVDADTDIDFGTYLGNTTGKVHFTIENGPKVTIVPSGNTGIGTTNPSEKLEVTGNVKAASYKYTSPKTYFYSVHPSAFQAEFPTDKIYKDFSTVFYFNPPAGTYMVAPVNLPHGATITGFTVYFVDNSATENLRVVFLYHPHSAAGGTELARVVTSGTPGTANLTAPALAHVVNNQLANYCIEANAHSDNPWPGGDLQIQSILITYTLSEVL